MYRINLQVAEQTVYQCGRMKPQVIEVVVDTELDATWIPAVGPYG